jgi:hypothetical protein
MDWLVGAIGRARPWTGRASERLNAAESQPAVAAETPAGTALSPGARSRDSSSAWPPRAGRRTGGPTPPVKCAGTGPVLHEVPGDIEVPLRRRHMQGRTPVAVTGIHIDPRDQGSTHVVKVALARRPQQTHQALDRALVTLNTATDRSSRSPRRIGRLLLTRPENLRDTDRGLFSEFTAVCPEMIMQSNGQEISTLSSFSRLF